MSGLCWLCHVQGVFLNFSSYYVSLFECDHCDLFVTSFSLCSLLQHHTSYWNPTLWYTLHCVVWGKCWGHPQLTGAQHYTCTFLQKKVVTLSTDLVHLVLNVESEETMKVNLTQICFRLLVKPTQEPKGSTCVTPFPVWSSTPHCICHTFYSKQSLVMMDVFSK